MSRAITTTVALDTALNALLKAGLAPIGGCTHLTRVTSRILSIAEDRPRDAFTPYQFTKTIKCQMNSVRIALKRLKRTGRIAHVGLGLYQHPSGLVYPGGVDPRLRIHALKIEARGENVPKGGGWPYPRLESVVYHRFASPGMHRHANNGSITTRGEWKGRLLSITLHPEKTRLLEVFMEASTFPLHFIEVHAYLSGFIPGAFGLPTELWEVKQADWNIDLPGSIKTDLSFTSMSVAHFERFILKIYQKAEKIRTEVRSFDSTSIKTLLDYCEGILRTVAEAH